MKKLLTILAISAAVSSPIQADEVYQQSAVDLCQSMKQKSYTKQCLSLVKEASFNEQALEHCKNIGSWNKVKSCLELIKDKDYQQNVLTLCQSSKYFNKDFKGCMNEIADKAYVSDIEVGLCEKEKTFSKQVKCLKTAKSRPYSEAQAEEQASSDKALAELQQQVKEAYELLRNNKSADATILLHNLVTGFDKK